MKRVLSLVLVLVLCLGVLSMSALAAIPFRDVPTSQWYYNDVSNAYEMGLINGKTDTAFKPDDNLTYAEAVKLAACMNQRYSTGSVSLQNGNPWYQTYVDYCKTKKIIDVDYAWDQPATRAGYMEIFAGALRGAGKSRVPMVIMLFSFVAFRQMYLFVMANFISNTVVPIALGYPAGWMMSSCLILIYYRRHGLSGGQLVEAREDR